MVSQSDKKYLLEGFQYSFRIPFEGPRVPFFAGNLPSVHGLDHVVRQKIMKEKVEGRILGTFPSPLLRNLHISPLGVVPKKAAGKFRLIHHLSYPKRGSVNDGIPEQLCSVCYTSLDEAVAIVKHCRAGAWMAKADIKSAFHLLPVHPNNSELLGFFFEGQYFMD